MKLKWEYEDEYSVLYAYTEDAGYSIEDAGEYFFWEAFSPNHADRLANGNEKTLEEAKDRCQDFCDTQTTSA